jgi:hypothetical protein
MSTYSLAIKGALSGQPAAPLTEQISDPAARPGSMAYNAMTGSYFLCKNPDGSESYYKLDAERSTVANPIVVRV